MCNYKYTLRQKHRSIGKKCPYTKFYGELKNNKTYNLENIASDIELPLDNHGICIFHSNELEWKVRKNFTIRFLELLQLLDSYANDEDYYDFAEFVFVGEYLETGKDVEFHLADRVLKKTANFRGALFVDIVKFNNIKFELGATFDQARFHNTLSIKNVSFGGTDFSQATFRKKVLFEKVNFLNSYALFTNSQFDSSVFFINSKFDGIVDFSDVTFRAGDDNQATVKFENVTFGSFVNFTDSVFSSSTSFSKVKFNSNVEFINTSFNTTKSTIRYSDAAIRFDKIEVNEGGLLIFKSTDAQNKMFKQEVFFSFKTDVKGIIRFENVNFNRIMEKSRKELLRLSKLGKVEIGLGCIKYRFQTEPKTVFIDKDNQSLVLELTQTFTNYFTVKNGLNLGFEIVERENDKVRFFYFTDENITEVEFLERLKKTEQNLWNLLSVKIDEQYLLTDGKSEINLSEENAIINAIDGISALLGTFFRVGIRIAFGRWFQRDTKALINSIAFDNQQTKLSVEELHQVLSDKYTGRTLLSINDNQNQNLVSINVSNQDWLIEKKNSMELPVTLQKEIIDFLLSLLNLHDNYSQRAFIYQAGLDPQLQNQILFGKPSTQFVPFLVSILMQYGKLNDGRHALEAILETAKNYVGQDKQADCDTLLQKLNTFTLQKKKRKLM